MLINVTSSGVVHSVAAQLGQYILTQHHNLLCAVADTARVGCKYYLWHPTLQIFPDEMRKRRPVDDNDLKRKRAFN